MKKIIIIALATIAIAATALIAVPALAKESPAQAQKTPVASLTTATSTPDADGAAFCGGGLAFGDTVTLQRVAATLGITYDQLVQRLQNGETIAAIATAQKVDLSKVVDVVVAAQTDMVNLMVKYGYLTQDQANTIIANLRTRVEAALSGTAPTNGYGMMGGTFGGMMGGTFGAGPDGSTTTPVTGYGYGMMGGRGRGMMGW